MAGAHRKGTLFGKPVGEVIKRPGAFTRKASAAGKTVAQHAATVTKPGSKASTRTKRQANLAKTLRRFSRSR